jgi:5-formyltetrahydrofolate cyclo-ligase
MISSEKQMLRLHIEKSLRGLDDTERAAKSAVLSKHLAQMLGEEAAIILGFAPMRFEPDWLSCPPPGIVALPRIEGERLIFHRMGRPEELARGAFGAREPAADEATVMAIEDAGVVLVPGVAFDSAGGRLGRGGGFYDRFLATPGLRARRIAVCFACQVVDRVPVEPHDAEVDAIVTEDGWIEVRSSGRGRD